MNIVFISNYLNHHQLPFCNELYKRVNSNFTFIAMKPMSEERKKLGWKENSKYQYELRAFESILSYKESRKVIENADVIILGSSTSKIVKRKDFKRKIILRYSERIYKNGLNFKNFLRAMFSAYKYHGRYKKDEVYLLCASAYVAYDMSIFGNYLNKSLRWGYFPKTIEYDVDSLFEKKNNKKVVILWVGRFVDWKHPEIAIELAESLLSKNIEFELNMIGTGEKLEELIEIIELKKISNYVNILGPISPSEVRRYMEVANIFLSTSDFNEGWGVVINEAMNSGCTVLVSHAVGSAPFLVNHKVNGVMYQNDNFDDLVEKAYILATDHKLIEKYGKEAYKTIYEHWNASVATDRLLRFVNAKVNHKEIPIYTSGPLSIAQPVQNDWFI